MHDPEQLTREHFAQHLDSYFHVIREGLPSLAIKLVEVTEVKHSSSTERFSILFEGPLVSLLPQQIYTLQHELMGTFELFLVPVFREESCFVYEALFNRIVKRNASTPGG